MVISSRLGAVILRELNLSQFELADSTTADEVPGWDSLRHVDIISAVEKEYSIRFKTMEILRLRSVGDLQALVDRRTGTTS